MDVCSCTSKDIEHSEKLNGSSTTITTITMASPTIQSKIWNIAITAIAVVALPVLLQTYTQTTYPILVIKSHSMYPAFSRGDIVFLSNRTAEVRVGDIPAVWFEGREEPMIHRVVRVWDGEAEGDEGTERVFVTKGDNNEVDDLVLYPEGRAGVRRREVLGVATGSAKGLGWPSLWVREVWWVRWVFGGMLAFSWYMGWIS